MYFMGTSGVSRVCLRGVSKSCKFKWLLKVGASKGVTAWLKKSWPGGGVSGQPKKTSGYATGNNIFQRNSGSVSCSSDTTPCVVVKRALL